MSLVGSYVGSYLGSFIGPNAAGIPEDTEAPTITVSPASGTSIRPDQVITIDIDDNVGLLVVAIFATFPNKTQDVIYDNDDFGRYYKGASNARTVTAGGLRFTVKRDGDWIGTPRFTYIVVDSSGNLGVLA